MISNTDSTVKLRSIHAGSMDQHDLAEAQSGFADTTKGGGKEAPVDTDDFVEYINNISNNNNNNNNNNINGEEEDLDASDPEPPQLPESTHSLFFTQPIFSLPFAYALSIYSISMASLVMALYNSVPGGSPKNPLSVPANVPLEVAAAQYLGIFIVLLMEGEIPTGLTLLRVISSSSFKKKLPTKSHTRFVCSAILRILLGYAFLANAFVIIAQSEGVLNIFFNVLALQFLEELDDIAFELAKKEVLGVHLRRACTAKLFQTEFEKQKFKRNKIASVFLKSVYFINLGVNIGGMIAITSNQAAGYYQCESITVDFGGAVWDDAIVRTGPDGQYESGVPLVFSTFSGVYRKEKGERVGFHAGRPVYKEARKSDGEIFTDTVVPAEIKYDTNIGAWTVSHPDILQSIDEPGWLLRSPPTNEYDLLEVSGSWSIWLGVISPADVTYSCNTCDGPSDCNLNGNCVDGECQCKSRTGLEYMGTHCQVKLKDSCGSIITETSNITYSTLFLEDVDGNENKMLQVYNRPIYNHIEGFPGAKEDDLSWIIYTGWRWVYIGVNPGEVNSTVDEVISSMENYHGEVWSFYHFSMH